MFLSDHYCLFNSNPKEFTQNCIAADISELREADGNVICADVTDPTSRDFEELAEEFGFLAPLEEQDKPAAEQQIGSHFESTKAHEQRDYGAIVVDNVNLNVPKNVIPGGEEKLRV